MLSGFVIFNLLDNQHQDTPTFLIQRFFRLFPLYLTVLLVSAATQQWQVETVAALPWRNEAIDNDLEIHAAALAHLPAQLAAHLTMLHGLVPGFLLPLSDYTLLGQAWSISVEWQFYLVAPLLFAMAMRRPLALGLLLLVIAAVRGRSWLGEGFAINQAGYFLIGTLSYVVWRRLRTIIGLESRRVWLGGIAATTLVYCLLPRSVSLVIWILTLTVVIDAHCARDGIARRLAAALRTRAPQWLGRVSSSVYLTHMLVLYAAFALLLHTLPGRLLADHRMVLALLLPLTVGGTLVLSWATYAMIEKPGIERGHGIARAWRAVSGWQA